jgi:hypothetical protein
MASAPRIYALKIGAAPLTQIQFPESIMMRR